MTAPTRSRLRSLRQNRLRSGLLVLTLGVGALPHGARLEPLLHHVGAAALRALLGYRLPPGDELAVRIPVASVQRPPLLRTARDDLAFRAVRTLHPDGLLLYEFARRVIAARRELA